MTTYTVRIPVSRVLVVLQCALMISAGAALISAPAVADCPDKSNDPSVSGCQTKIISAGRTIDPARAYTLDELIEIAEQNNPRTRIAWEQAKGAAERAAIVRSAYFPKVEGVAAFADERIINPFPKPLAPLGYTMVEIPSVDSGLEIAYTVFDFGRRRSDLQASAEKWLAASELWQRSTQDVAYRVVVAYYDLTAASERLSAIRQILNTARVTQAAVEAQLANGRATIPDVLNAKAVTAKAEYDMETASGDDAGARVRLREALGLEPSEAITVAPQSSAPTDDAVSGDVTSFVEAAARQRPDLRALSERLKAAEAETKAARASFRPSIDVQSKAASQSLWPSFSQPSLGDTTQFVWQVGLRVRWDFFDGGSRKHEVLLRQAEEREATEEFREKRDEITRDTWIAYLRLRTSFRQYAAAQTLLEASISSYDSSMEAYGYGVKSLIDVVTAEAQLSQARLALVQARSSVFISSANLEYAVGTLMSSPKSAKPLIKPAENVINK